MAEIRVEPRKAAPIWPWIVGLLIILGLIWVLVEAFSDEEVYDEPEVEEVEVGYHPASPNDTTTLTLYS
jgi:hypothetical protein